MKNNKKIWFGIVCVILAVALIVGGVLIAGSNSKEPDPTGPSSTTSNDNVTGPGTVPTIPDVTNPTDGSADNSVIEPNAPTVTDPTEPENPAEPENPTEPESPTEPEQPTEPEKPTEPETPEEKPSEPEKEDPPETVKPTEPPKPVEYIQGNGYKRVKDFDPATNTGEKSFYMCADGIFRIYEDEYIFEITPKTLTNEIWCSWELHTQMSFIVFSDQSNMTIDERYTYIRITELDNYSCGWENHYCYGEQDHQNMLENMDKGCRYCGKTDCVSFYARNDDGFTITDIYACPEYDAHKDPSRYCQYCGYRKWSEVIPGEIQCTRQLRYDQPCLYCGVMTYVGQCHHCVVPADYVPSKPGHFHAYDMQITAPTCTQPGIVRYVCSCGDSSEGEEIPAPGHAYGDWVVVKEATPDEEGIEQITCSACGKVLSRPVVFCADNDDAEAIARLLIDDINQYRAEEGVGPATTMEKCMVYAKLRSEQMAAKGVAEHNTDDEHAAATQLRYGTYIDPALYGRPNEAPYYYVNASEAVGKDRGTTIESVAETLATGFRNSSAHWSYVGVRPYIAVGVTMDSDGYWYCCIVMGRVNLDEKSNGT